MPRCQARSRDKSTVQSGKFSSSWLQKGFINICTKYQEFVEDSKATSTSQKLQLVILMASGSFSPVHRSHIAMVQEAKIHLQELRPELQVVAAYVAPSSEAYVNGKLGDHALSLPQRNTLCAAVCSKSDWIECCPLGVVSGWRLSDTVIKELSTLCKEAGIPIMPTTSKERKQHSIRDSMNINTDNDNISVNNKSNNVDGEGIVVELIGLPIYGADFAVRATSVFKYPTVIVGRVGSTQKVKEEIRKRRASKVIHKHFVLIEADLPAISSTRIREEIAEYQLTSDLLIQTSGKQTKESAQYLLSRVLSDFGWSDVLIECLETMRIHLPSNNHTLTKTNSTSDSDSNDNSATGNIDKNRSGINEIEQNEEKNATNNQSNDDQLYSSFLSTIRNHPIVVQDYMEVSALALWFLTSVLSPEFASKADYFTE